jgi:hypothetical protein
MMYKDEIVAEVRQHRQELLEEYGGIDGYLRHQEVDRSRLEKEGWIFITPEEIIAKRHAEAINA